MTNNFLHVLPEFNFAGKDIFGSSDRLILQFLILMVNNNDSLHASWALYES